MVAAVGVILAELSSGELPKAVTDIVFPLSSLAKNSSKIDTTLQNLVKQNSKIDTTFQNLVKQNLKIDTTLQNLVKQNSKIDTTFQNLVKQNSKIDTTLQNLVKQDSVNNARLQDIRDSLTKVVKSQNLVIHTSDNNAHLQTIRDSLTKVVKSQTDSLTEALESQKVAIDSIKHAQNSVRLLVGIEEKLKQKKFLETSRFLWLKSYRLVKELSSKDTLVTIGEPFPLESAPQELVGSGPFELKALVYHRGKLKKHEYTIVKKDSTFITFKSFLGGMDILAVVELKKKK